ncbi:MAG: Fic family protein [Actinomycetota bacterium]|nr:Fic family protein [Actinomycetota bacterium]
METVVSSIVFAAELPAATVAARVRRGDLVRLATGVYTSDAMTAPERVVLREWHTIIGRLYPRAVITDRSAVTGGPADGVLYLAHDGRNRETHLPGLIVRARSGTGPMADDAALPGGLYQASKPRALVENTAPSRARGANARRTLSDDELADWIDRLAMIDGDEKIQNYRVEAESLAQTLGATSDRTARLSRLIGAALGTQEARTGSMALAARQSGIPYDRDRMRLLGTLIEALHESAPQNRAVADPTDEQYRHLPFFESYFSNFIEGTEFEVDQAVAIVYEGARIPGRADDSHDLLGTYRIVNDLADMRTVATDANDFIQLLRSRHATILAGRPDKNPGMFKELPNRAGDTAFVLPTLVDGTLRAGWSRLAELDTPFERAVYAMFLVSEVHPFDDGNGRVARVMMNAELVAGAQGRIIVPTVFRDDYLDGLRMFSRQDRPGVLIRALRYAHDYTSQISWRSVEAARQTLEATHAFNEPNSADRLVLPGVLRRIGPSAPNRSEQLRPHVPSNGIEL